MNLPYVKPEMGWSEETRNQLAEVEEDILAMEAAGAADEARAMKTYANALRQRLSLREAGVDNG